MFEVNTKQLKEAMIRDFKVGLVPMVASSPGMGKSDVVKNIAEEFKLKLIDSKLILLILAKSLTSDVLPVPFGPIMRTKSPASYAFLII